MDSLHERKNERKTSHKPSKNPNSIEDEKKMTAEKINENAFN